MLEEIRDWVYNYMRMLDELEDTLQMDADNYKALGHGGQTAK